MVNETVIDVCRRVFLWWFDLEKVIRVSRNLVDKKNLFLLLHLLAEVKGLRVISRIDEIFGIVDKVFVDGKAFL